MKQVLLVTLVTICLLSSCSKDGAPTTDKVDEAALTAVMSLKNNSQLLNAYALLKPTEKLELWKRHIVYFTQSRYLTSEQSAFLTEFSNQWLVKNLFENNSTIIKDFNLALPQIKYKAQSLFGVQDAFALLMDLPSDRIHYKNTTSMNHDDIITVQVNSIGKNDCSCSRTDSYCNVGNCRDNGCSTSNLGCGTLFLYSCNGVCSLI